MASDAPSVLALDRVLIPAKSFLYHQVLRGDYQRYLALRARVMVLASRAGLYEGSTMRAVAVLVRPGDVVLDVGANFGAFTSAFGSLVGPAGRVDAFEPQPDVFHHLQARFGNQANVRLLQLALGATAGVGHLSVPSIAGDVPEPALGALSDHGIEITVTTVDEHCADFDRLRYLKVDAEGHDLDVLLGGRETLLRLRPIVQFECNDPGTLSTFTDFAPTVGYHLAPVIRGSNHWLLPD